MLSAEATTGAAPIYVRCASVYGARTAAASAAAVTSYPVVKYFLLEVSVKDFCNGL